MRFRHVSLLVAGLLVLTAGPAAALPSPGTIGTVAGGVGGPGPATQVSLSALGTTALGPCGVTYGDGRLYVPDVASVRSVSPATGRLTTVAGTGVTGPLGDGGPATSASLGDACGAAVDAAGNLVIADGIADRVQLVAHGTGTFYGQPMTAGHIYTVAGTGSIGTAGNGGPATEADVTTPGGVAVDAAGNLIILDSY